MMAGFTVAMVGAAEVHMRVSPSRRATVYDPYMRAWAGGLLRIFGIRIEGEPRPPPANARARLIVSNHRSPLDILVLIRLFGGRIVSRADLSGWPVLGAAARQAGTIFVDRESESSGARAIRTIRRHLAAGSTITVFPEGATYPGDDVRPFRAGAFVAPRGLDVEIVPVGLAYPAGTEFWQETFLTHIQRVAGRFRTPVGVAIGEPVVPTGRTPEIAEAMHDEVQRLVARARRYVRSEAP
jgi:1-acyl-sn-glycerol-3-phosphate acyltransferase